MGEGTVYESLNMASLYAVPLLVVIENNRYAQSTPIEKNMAGSIRGRIDAFGIDSSELDTSDAEEIYSHYRDVVDKVRRTQKPHVGIINTHRFAPHSKGDDHRPREYMETLPMHDPLTILSKKLDDCDLQQIARSVDEEMCQILNELKIKV